MAATGDSARQAVDLDNLIQEYMHFEKVRLNFQKRKDSIWFFLISDVIRIARS